MNRRTSIRNRLFATTLPLAAAFPPAVSAEPATFVVDDEHFSMMFEIMHIGYAPVMGLFRDVEGQFVYDEQARTLNSGTLVFQSDSIYTNHEERDEHLRSDDFLDSDDHPEIRFSVTGFETTGQNTGKVTGDLTLLGKIRPVTLDVTLNKSAEYPIGHEEYTLGITAETTLKRSEWGMTYGLDPALVGDEVTLRFGFEANRDS
ncbi:MAG TPA: YceI family protein [Marinobacter sp.]|uniref:YceI family protein n=1 Tax=Marinobacter sp. TaxID=50741 RepID=UPI00263859AB|nr:YceI family protein [Marinobacter sp.]HET8800116.1 YceI family protein [Marinobacter sp.]